jgi:hypothetical protein
MAARYCLTQLHYHNTVSGKDEYVHIGALRDSAHQSVVQNPSLFQSAPLTTAQIHPNLVQFLLTHTAGP